MIDPALEKAMRRRVVLVGICGVLVAVGLIFRAYDLQVRSGSRFTALAQRQHTAKVTFQARRGMIFDRNGTELAISLPVESVFAQPALLQDSRAAAKVIAKPLGLDAGALAKRLLEPGRSFVWVARHIEPDQIQKVRALDLEGVGFIEESKRYYPKGELAGHVLGFAGVDSVGLEGIEYTYNNYLRGNAEEVVGARDARGRAILARGIGSLERLQGDHLTLTLDANIQYIAQRELSRGLEEAGAKAGTVVVMDPATGEVLALAVEPEFDPNAFDKFTSAQFRNRAITDVYEPGSTLKAFLLAGAVEAGAVSPSDIFYCENGTYDVYDRTFHDTKPHGWLSASNILKVSSNIGAIKIAERLGGSSYYEFLRKFGFGRKTGIDLAGEVDGLLSSPRHWSGVTLATLAFGQGIGVTPIQLVSAMGALANGGVLLKPTVLRQVKDAEGRIVQRSVAQVIDRVVSEETARKLTRVLAGVTADDGTGKAAQISGYLVAGKTGTAQKIDPETGLYSGAKRVVSFLGYAPATAPRLAMIVLLDEPRENVYGGSGAAPIFARIAEQTLAYLEVPPEVATRQPAGPLLATERISAPAWEGPGAQWEPAVAGSSEAARAAMPPPAVQVPEGTLPSFSGMPLREVLRWRDADRVQLHWEGHGVVVGQEPRPGTPMAPGMQLTLVLEPPG